MINSLLVLALYCVDLSGIPSCLKKEIRTFGADAVCADAHVDEMEFRKKKVYVFNPGTCGADMTSAVKDSKCRQLGDIGGITGNRKISGMDFGEAKLIRTIWKKTIQKEQ
jgi:hypothetical protein